MKSSAFRNLVLGFYISLGIIFIPLCYYTLEFLGDLVVWFSKNTQDLVTGILCILFFLIVIATSKFKQAVIILAIYLGSTAICSILILAITKGDKAVFSIILLVTLVLIVSLGHHTSFDRKRSLSTNDDTILDDFDTHEKSYTITPEAYFLRIHRIFSLIVVCAALGLIFLGTFMTGGHISDEEGFGLIALSIPIFIVAFLVWKFPKILSYLVALTLFIGGLFLELAIAEQMSRSLFKENTILLKTAFIVGQVGFILTCVFLILIILSKTARQEWKMK